MPKATQHADTRNTPKAKRTSKQAKLLAELPPQSDPRAPLELKLLLKATAPILRRLEADLHERAQASLTVKLRLEAEHKRLCEAKRCADEYPQWLQAFVEQLAAAWVLACVFVRTLEDRGLLEHNRLAGPGAADSLRQFLGLAPSLSERDYIQLCLRELLHLPAADALFGQSNPLWLLAPSAEGARALLELFRTPNADAPALRFGQADTRFLGDLYQDLNENVRARYALLQTPDFVVEYILDRTLDPAIERFGLDRADVIDPTCGSGHFLIAAFDRLYELHQRKAPNELSATCGQRAIANVFGTDINPYAVAISRFRLLLAFLEKTGIARLKQAPKLDLNIVVADSLLHSERDAQVVLDRVGDTLKLFGFERDPEAHALLNRKAKFAAVLGNPPYITVKDDALRELYRKAYSSAVRQYSLGVPFTERFFDLARAEGYVGMITANSFMKREFGKKLIEDFLPQIDLRQIVNTAGAYIPGHGTPTVLLIGRRQAPRGNTVRVVLGKHGEPSTPAEPSDGLVWSTIRDHSDQLGYEDNFISVSDIARAKLTQHPWSLAGGGAEELMTLLEQRAHARLGNVIAEIGRTTVCGEDDAWILSANECMRLCGEDATVPLVIGEAVRDWAFVDCPTVIYPYEQLGGAPVAEKRAVVQRYLWRYRTLLQNRTVFGKSMVEKGACWFEHLEHYRGKLRTPLSIAFAFVATHNHFVLDRGGKVFNRTAPIIKLPDGATENDHFALLAYLNSSTACFWIKQVMTERYSPNQKHNPELVRRKYEFAGTALERLPVPKLKDAALTSYAKRLTELGIERSNLLARPQIMQLLAANDGPDVAELWREVWQRWTELTDLMCALQEELDWYVYQLFDLVPKGAPTPIPASKEKKGRIGGRPFERKTGLNQGFTKRLGLADNEIVPIRDVPSTWFQREKLCQSEHLSVLEAAVYKRVWRFSETNVAPGTAMAEYQLTQLEMVLGGELERSFTDSITTANVLTAAAKMRLGGWDQTVDAMVRDAGQFHRDLFTSNAVPFLSSLTLSEAGLSKRRLWAKTWESQRREDAGEPVGQISVPPTYEQKDFCKPEYWRLRGKLDVPKEPFISYPGLESDEDGEPIYGWAGWDHAQRARALLELYQTRKDEEGWKTERLIPALAGLHELLPWVKQWHNEPDAEYDGARLGDELASYLAEELRGHGLTEADLLAWRPEARGRATARKAKPSKPPNSPALKPPIKTIARKVRGANDNSAGNRRRKEAAQ